VKTVTVHLNYGRAVGVGPHHPLPTCRRCGAWLEQGDPLTSYQLLDNPTGEWRVVCDWCGDQLLAHYRDTLHLPVWSHVNDRWEFMLP